MEYEMRLKSAEGPLTVHNGNGNNDILNSPKRINTIQNSNLGQNFTSNLTSNLRASARVVGRSGAVIEDLDGTTTAGLTGSGKNENTLNNTDDTVQWCISARHQQKRELTNNANNRNNHLFNINNTLAATLRDKRHGTASPIGSEYSPDDSILDYEEAQQSCSSVDTSPQDEDRGFDISDSESLSEEGNLSNTGPTLQRRGIVNPNYPGFQHLAHTLDYSIKASSDTDFTDDDLECESLTAKLDTDANNINNNNVEDTEFQVDQIDSVNRLDSVENIQKVFYDKPVFNIPVKRTNCESEEGSANSNQGSDDDLDLNAGQNIEFNIKADEAIVKSIELRESTSCGNIIGDFGEEVEREFGRITRENRIKEERATIQELEEAVEKLSVSADIQPSAAKYNIEPNIEQPFNKLSPEEVIAQPVVLEDSKIIKQTEEMATMMHTIRNDQNKNIKMRADKNSTSYLTDAFLSNVHESLPIVNEKLFVDTNQNRNMKMEVDPPLPKKQRSQLNRKDSNRENEELPKLKLEPSKSYVEEQEKFCKENFTKDDKEKDEDSTVPRKKEKIELSYVKKSRDYNQQIGSLITIPRRDSGSRSRDNINRRSVPMARDKKKGSSEILGGFDVYNIETDLPKIDLEAIESHLRAAKEEERRKRMDREEIRRRLASGPDEDYYSNYDRPGRKPRLQERLQSGMNLQICFMNETVSDTESPSSDSECTMTNLKQPKISPKNISIVHEKPAPPTRPASLSIGQPLLQPVTQPMTETDFFARQARLQTEARMALAQAKEMARMQMEIERQRQKKSPITEMVRNSLEKVGIPFPEERRRLSRQILTEMNVAQLQVIVNDLHTQIETLNENLVKFLMDRDDLHMEQDSMLVDIEDLTRYLGAKEQTIKEQNLVSQNNNIPPPSPAPSSPLAALNSSVKPHLHRIASLVKK